MIRRLTCWRPAVAIIIIVLIFLHDFLQEFVSDIQLRMLTGPEKAAKEC